MKTLTAILFTVCVCFTSSFAQDADTKENPADAQNTFPDLPTIEPLDVDRVTDAGLSVHTGQHLALISDIRDDAKASDLVAAFDQAVPQWCAYFGVDESRAKDWKLRAFLITGPNKYDRFKKANLFPEALPNFAAGFQKDHFIYLFDQPGPYYSRHLLLHEGTHGFMQWFLNGYGAPWYSEGIAELLAVHQLRDDKLKLLHRLSSRDDAPYWGRVKLLKNEYADGLAMSLDDVLAIPAGSFRNVRFYAWSWAASEFFNNHPLSGKAFRELRGSAGANVLQFNDSFKEKLKPHWKTLSLDWNIFIDEMEYGFDVTRGRVTPATATDATPLGIDGGSFAIDSTRAWQQTGITVKKGDRIKVTSSGRIRIGQTIIRGENIVAGESATKKTNGTVYPWTSESSGISIRYYRGRPLGMLDAGILPADKPDGGAAISRPTPDRQSILTVPVGGDSTIEIPASGLLCFRINESPADFDDNQGALDVTVRRVQ